MTSGRIAAAARVWVDALYHGDLDRARRLLSPMFGTHNGGDAEHYLHHERQQYAEHAPFAGWEQGWDVRVTPVESMGCWSVQVLNHQGEPTTRFWWWWDEHGVASNGWPFQMIPKLAWGPWGVRRKITHDAQGWRLLPVGACQDVQHEQHGHDDGFAAVSWCWDNDQGDAAQVQVHAVNGGRRFKTTLCLPGRQESGYRHDRFPRLDGRAVWVPPGTSAFALSVRTTGGTVHLDHPADGWVSFDAPVLQATVTDRLDHDWTVIAPPN